MKGLVGDAIGNMSISPTSRDIVLAARKGLFIIDLEAPLEVPRFLPQGGTWDVADVQWNPHPQRAEYIVSTSSERLLIWNLFLVGKTAIEHILQSHYRAITDINWHTSEPDLVCSTGIDSWIWAWDLRTPMKPIFPGLCAFNAGGTQIKWNRQDQHILASSHLNEVLVWDRRKGSEPLLQIKAHKAKIYGIDWSHHDRNEIVTCSLDKTVKIWDIHDPKTQHEESKLTYETMYPVWRARDLPFGKGFLSLPQRGETALEMWSHSDTTAPVETFEGHTDVVKEFVWRYQDVTTRNPDGREFQLITWSKDKTLRFWPVPREMMQKTGSITKESELTPKFQYKDDWVSFRSPPPGTDPLPALSVPVGFRSILAEVRAPVHSQTTNPVLLPHRGSAARGLARETPQSKDSNGTRPVHPSSSVPSSIAGRRGGTMSKGSAVGKPAKIDPFQWLSSVRPETVSSSRHSSDSRPTSGPDKDGSGTDSGSRKRSQSRGRGDDGGHREAEKSASSLLDEIHSVDRKLTSSKIKLEKYDLTKRRTCTFGLHGPWGDSATVHVFIRVTFAFPRDYPHASYPGGVPTVDIERTPLVSTKRRAYMVRRLREIRETRRPCLEPCLRFLLFSDGRQPGRSPSIDSGSSSEDERPQDGRKSRDLTVAILRDHKNLAEPRTSQGVFGPNGQLVCFFRSLPRIVKSAHGDISSSPSLAARGAETVPKLFQSPLLLSDAVRRLVVSANDQSFGSLQSKWPEDSENIIRIMNNLVSFSQPGRRAFENTRSAEKVPGNYALVTKRVTVIHIKDRAFVVGAHRAVAADYEHLVDDPAYFCETNAAVAHSHSRFDHERVFRFLRMFFHTRKDGHRRGDELNNRDRQGTPLSSFMIVRQYKELLASRDIQLLAMFVVVVLKMYRQQAMKCEH
ncbi:WD40 repeat-like protein [Rickenella mellea]|uniref:WD40 repeat-like protein n=1 Tax=Rickenella mellea TaxID=50990 RepID=A0A4Y7PZC7_9AGAM|nr:WD40 repeat-like protein [Rickenella mellea]